MTTLTGSGDSVGGMKVFVTFPNGKEYPVVLDHNGCDYSRQQKVLTCQRANNVNAMVDILKNLAMVTQLPKGTLVNILLSWQYLTQNNDEVYFNGHSYVWHCGNDPKFFPEAKTYCTTQKRFGMTGYLTTITSAEEQDVVSQYVHDNSLDQWICGRKNNGDWHWECGPEDGKPFTYTHWKANNPGISTYVNMGPCKFATEDCKTREWETCPNSAQRCFHCEFSEGATSAYCGTLNLKVQVLSSTVSISTTTTETKEYSVMKSKTDEISASSTFSDSVTLTESFSLSAKTFSLNNTLTISLEKSPPTVTASVTNLQKSLTNTLSPSLSNDITGKVSVTNTHQKYSRTSSFSLTATHHFPPSSTFSRTLSHSPEHFLTRTLTPSISITKVKASMSNTRSTSFFQRTDTPSTSHTNSVSNSRTKTLSGNHTNVENPKTISSGTVEKPTVSFSSTMSHTKEKTKTVHVVTTEIELLRMVVGTTTAVSGASLSLYGKISQQGMSQVILLGLMSCGSEDVFEVDRAMHPTGISIGGGPTRVASGAVAMALVFDVLYFLIFLGISYFLHRIYYTQHVVPGLGLVVFIYFAQPMSFCSFRILFLGEIDTVQIVIAVFGVCTQVMFVMLLGTQVWRRPDITMELEWSLVFGGFRKKCGYFGFIDYLWTVMFGLVGGFYATTSDECRYQLYAVLGLFILRFGTVIALRPFHNYWDLFVCLLLDGSSITALLLLIMEYMEEAQWTLGCGASLSLIVVIASNLPEFWTTTRHLLSEVSLFKKVTSVWGYHHLIEMEAPLQQYLVNGGYVSPRGSKSDAIGGDDDQHGDEELQNELMTHAMMLHPILQDNCDGYEGQYDPKENEGQTVFRAPIYAGNLRTIQIAHNLISPQSASSKYLNL